MQVCKRANGEVIEGIYVYIYQLMTRSKIEAIWMLRDFGMEIIILMCWKLSIKLLPSIYDIFYNYLYLPQIISLLEEMGFSVLKVREVLERKNYFIMAQKQDVNKNSWRRKENEL